MEPTGSGGPPFTQALLRRPGPAYLRHYRELGVEVDPDLAARQQRAYAQALAVSGLRVGWLDADPRYPDGVFLEDTFVLFRGRAMRCRMAPHREGEQEGVQDWIRRTHEVVTVPEEARIDGGDVLHTPEITYVGLSGRTNQRGVEALERFLSPWARRVVPVPVRSCLHLKTGVTWLGAGTLIACPGLVDPAHLSGTEILWVHPEEPEAANCLSLSGRILVSQGCPETLGELRRWAGSRQMTVEEVPNSEFAKGDGGLTCRSLRW